MDLEKVIDSLVEVRLVDQSNFLKIKETLTRIGVAYNKEKKLWQSCHILQKRGKYYIVHFKELFILDGKLSNFDESDLARRNSIANLLQEWGLVEIIDPDQTSDPIAEMTGIKVLPYSKKEEWTLIPKYMIGNKRRVEVKID